MIPLKKSLTTFAGLLGCLLVITSCCLFRSPKDPNQIQDPPPTDRNYLACRVNGKPVVFKRVSGPPFRKRYSSFHIEKDSVNKTTIVSLFLDGDNSSAFDTSVNLWLTQKFQFQKNIDDIDVASFEKQPVTNANFFTYESVLHELPYVDPELKGSITVTGFEYFENEGLNPKGRISGTFEFTCRPPYPLQENSHTVRITDGVFNVTLIE